MPRYWAHLLLSSGAMQKLVVKFILFVLITIACLTSEQAQARLSQEAPAWASLQKVTHFSTQEWTLIEAAAESACADRYQHGSTKHGDLEIILDGQKVLAEKKFPNEFLEAAEIHVWKYKTCLLSSADAIFYRGVKRTKLIRFARDGSVDEEIDYNQAPQRFKEIFPTMTQAERVELVRAQLDTRKVIVGLLDTGVEYNIPYVAKVLARVSREMLRDLENKKQELARLQLERRELLSEPDGNPIVQRVKGFLSLETKQSRLAEIDLATKKVREQIAKINFRIQNSEKFVGADFEDMDDRPFDYFRSLFNEGTHGTTMVRNLFDKDREVLILNVRYPFLGARELRSKRFVQAVDYSVRFGAKVINMSWGYDQELMTPLLGAIDRNKDTLFVAAAGNSHKDVDEYDVYPAAYVSPNLLSVALATKDGRLDRMSNYSVKKVEIAAVSDDGTSGAAAQVSKIAAKVLYRCPNFSGPQAKALLLESADKISALEPYVSGGLLLNAERALAVARERCR